VITVCDNANEKYPYFLSTGKKFHHNFPHPPKAKGSEEEIIKKFREVRAMIKTYCSNFIDDNL
jgi:arsenate reductase (thioredoxin)